MVAPNSEDETDQVVEIESLLTPRERHILWLRYRKHWKQEQIAEVFKIHQTTVHKTIEVAISKLESHRAVILEISAQSIDPEILAMVDALN